MAHYINCNCVLRLLTFTYNNPPFPWLGSYNECRSTHRHNWFMIDGWEILIMMMLQLEQKEVHDNLNNLSVVGCLGPMRIF